MRVSRSLTIKQMAMVSAVSMLFVFIFCVILLLHFVQQNRYNTATQLESIARSVREPLSSAILKGDIVDAETILKGIQPAGVVSRADVVLPNQFQALRMRFIPERPVPVTITRLFELPVQISLPIYSLQRPANPQPLAYLVLQADSYRMYKFVMSTLSTLVTAYLLLTLMITVAITWCINRLIVHPLRRIARELNDLPQHEQPGHQLVLPRHHHDDEIGMLVRSYNRHQQLALPEYTDPPSQAARFPVAGSAQKAMLSALDNHQYAIWLQPQIDLTTGSVLGAEALLHVRQPDGSWTLPEGLEHVENVGLMMTLGYRVLEAACRQLAAWQGRGIMLPLSVNISALQLMHHAMVPDLLALLSRYRIAPGTLILVVTESRRIDDPQTAVTILRPLRNAGVRIALDDFGMGYAGLRQLHRMKSLPVDLLKVDKTFVEGLPDDNSMVTAIIHMANSLDLDIIAEGVETDAQRDWLAASGVTMAQGFLFARAMPPDAFEARYFSPAADGENA